MKVVLSGQFLHLMVDLWTHTLSARKFIGIRITFIDSNWKFSSYFLALREFRISYEQSIKKEWTKVLGAKIVDIIEEFGIDLDDLISVTSDAGSDIKSFLTKK